MTEQIAISTSGLEVRYGETIALTGVDIAVKKGSVLSVIGPNGAGKSAFLKALAGTVKPFSGKVKCKGASPSFVLQSTDVDKSLPISVREVVSLGRYSEIGLFKRFSKTDHDIVDQTLHRMGVEELKNNQFHDLSGGQQQRVLIAQGLVQETETLLLDEPVNGLDITSREIILNTIFEEVDKGRTVVFSTHDLNHARLSDEVLLLNTCPCCVGVPEEVLTETNLRDAYGDSHIHLDDELLLDDPHHTHTSSHNKKGIRNF
tara:strand:+ start:221 stop:1000 length:780 start_codon:yes stop_codon:yes gene_type:complete